MKYLAVYLFGLITPVLIVVSFSIYEMMRDEAKARWENWRQRK